MLGRQTLRALYCDVFAGPDVDLAEPSTVMSLPLMVMVPSFFIVMPALPGDGDGIGGADYEVLADREVVVFTHRRGSRLGHTG